MPEEDDENEALPHILPDQAVLFLGVYCQSQMHVCFRALTHIDMCSAATELVYIKLRLPATATRRQSWPCDGLFVRTWWCRVVRTRGDPEGHVHPDGEEAY